LLLRVGRSQHARLFHEHLELHFTLFIDPSFDAPLLSNQYLAQLLPHLLQLCFRDLIARKLRILGLRILDELIELLLISRLFEEFLNLGIRDIRGGRGRLIWLL